MDIKKQKYLENGNGTKKMNNKNKIELACLALERRLIEHDEDHLYNIVIEESPGKTDLLLQHKKDHSSYILIDCY